MRLAAVAEWPLIGTPAWCALDDHHPAKWAAILEGSERNALRLETDQEARAQASHAISTAVDWRAIAQRSAARAAFYEAHPWLKRVSQ